VTDTLAETLSRAGVRQLHAAETEKYAHVTYFLNGGREEAWAGETRVLVPSPRDVGTYDKKPAMSAPEVARRFADEVATGEYGFAIVNFANPDMVGHTGVIPAVIEAVEMVDECLGVVVDALHAAAGVASSPPTTATPSRCWRRTASRTLPAYVQSFARRHGPGRRSATAAACRSRAHLPLAARRCAAGRDDRPPALDIDVRRQ
jgi:hypothetical protein